MDELLQNLEELTAAVRAGAASPEQRVAVFAGAAISMAGPSYLPPAAPLIQAIVRTLLSEDVREVLRDADIDGDSLERRIVDANLIPEVLYQEIALYAGRGVVLDALKVLNSTELNANHLLLARLAKLGYLRLIITTNFDGLLELALERLSQPYEVLVGDAATPAVVQDTFTEGSSGRPLVLWKIHGDIARVNTPDEESRVIATLDQVGKPLNGRIAESLDALDGRHLLVLGYSANDLDLAGKIGALKYRRLYWNVRVRDRDQNRAVFGAMEHCGAAARWLVGDINEVLGKLADLAGALEPIAAMIPGAFQQLTDREWEEKIVTGIQSKLSAWNTGGTGAPVSSKAMVAATFLSLLGDRAARIRLFPVLLRRFPRFAAQIHHFWGTEVFQSRDYDLSISLLKKAVDLARSEAHDRVEGYALAMLGGVYGYVNQREAAVGSLRRSIEIARRLDDRVMEANAESALGTAYWTWGETDSAMEHTHRASEIYWVIGYVLARAKALALLSLMELSRKNNVRAEQLVDTAIALARAVGDVEAEALFTGNIAQIERITGQFQSSYDHYSKALDIFTSRKSIDGQAGVWAELGELHRLVNQLHEAVKCQLRAMQLHTQTGSITGLAADWLNLGRAHLAGSNTRMAKACATEAYLLFAQRENPRGMRQAMELFTLIDGKPPTEVRRGWSHGRALRSAKGNPYPESHTPLARSLPQPLN